MKMANMLIQTWRLIKPVICTGQQCSAGAFGSGTVFQLSPSGNAWVHTVLCSFTGGLDGGEPYKGVTLDAEGNLYGTAVTGGSGSCEGGCSLQADTRNLDSNCDTSLHRRE